MYAIINIKLVHVCFSLCIEDPTQKKIIKKRKKTQKQQQQSRLLTVCYCQFSLLHIVFVLTKKSKEFILLFYNDTNVIIMHYYAMSGYGRYTCNCVFVSLLAWFCIY